MEPVKHADDRPVDPARLKRAKHWLHNHHVPGWRRRIRHINTRLHRAVKRAKLAQLDRVLTEIRRLIAIPVPYLWGGGHASTPAYIDKGGDCSGYASHLGQVLSPAVWTANTTAMIAGSHGLSKGPGKILTFFVKSDHVIVRVTNPVTGKLIGWTQLGGSDNRHGGHVEWMNPSPERIAQFTYQCHPTGF